MRDNVLLLPKLGQLYSVYEHNFESPWHWGNSYRAFSLPKQWDGEHVGAPKQSCGRWTLVLWRHFCWVYITYFAHRNIGQWSGTTHFLLWFIQQKAVLVLVEERRVHNTQPNYSFLFVRKVVHILWRHVCKVFKCHYHWLQTLNKQLSR